MYLVHARLQGPPGVALPLEARSLVRAQAVEDDALEHVVAHPRALPHPVIGLYVRADNLAAAESRAARLCRRVLEREEFSGWSLVLAEAPMVALFYESLLTGSGLAAGPLDGMGQGPLRPAGSSSTPSDQRRE
ncbi:hypothetical protein OHS33_20555 [Streptomyces sp. NBC_00536]|uniref:hypothetical protein n=1 Tax=Streptomyces sp. NBC_00536 TaxID=2975769 RepID=UPI002E81B3A0|nr:hypothetical protein [Streptomyces sp. NBC_00536]WUC80504.1 hypothetical protein OHS33_20555 [Streptomyces sp. NBC_00536]